MSRRWGWGRRYASRFPRYVPVAERVAKAKRQMERLNKKGEKLDPVVIEGQAIARTFWGKAWCDHVEKHCDWRNRLGRGRSYVRNGSVCDLVIGPGHVAARVVGNDLYRVEVKIKKLPPARWTAIRKSSTGGIASVVELLRGRLSAAVMGIMTHPTEGLFPRAKEIEMSCSCPDYAVMCKHVAATLYGVGARLDSRPELLFVLRGVDQMQLIDEAVRSGGLTDAAAAGPAGIEESELAEVFGVEIETPASAPRKARVIRKPGKKGTTPGRPAEKITRRPAGELEGKGKRGKGTNQPAGKPPGTEQRGSKTSTPVERIARGAKAKAKAKAKPRGKKMGEHARFPRGIKV